MSAASGRPQPKRELPGIRARPVPDRVALLQDVLCAAGPILSPRAVLRRPARGHLHHRRIDAERTEVSEGPDQERPRETGAMQ
jgi:hypothetical protein